MRWIVALVLLFASTTNAQVDENGVLLNKLSKAEESDGWTLLWDGSTSNGWRSARSETFPEKGWSMEDGVLTVHGGGGDVKTMKEYDAFELSLEFKITAGANSGIKYFVFPEHMNRGTSLGLEYQLLDDEKHPDAKNGVGGNRTVASLYDLVAAENKVVYPPGEWNHVRIIAKKNGDVEHWLNGNKVVAYNRFSQVFRNLLYHSKYKRYEEFGRIPKGHILLQDHGDTVSFRNIKIRNLE